MDKEIENDKFLVHVYGDSLSLPRNSIGVPFYRIYSELLRPRWEKQLPNKKVYLYNWSRGDSTIESVFHEFKRESFYFGCKSDVLIIQVGVCDCAPRPIPMWVRNTISVAPGFIKNRVIGFLHRNRSRMLNAGFQWQIVPPDRFEEGYISFLSKAIEEFERIYLINVAPTIQKIEDHSPGFTSQIINYNEIIGGVVKKMNNDRIKLINIHDEILKRKEGIEHFIYDDGHHITSHTHQIYADLIWSKEEAKLNEG